MLGFADESHLRPPLPYKGAFLRAGAQQVRESLYLQFFENELLVNILFVLGTQVTNLT